MFLAKTAGRLPIHRNILELSIDLKQQFVSVHFGQHHTTLAGKEAWMNQRTSQPLETVKLENNEQLTIRRPETHSRNTGMTQGTRQRAC